MESRAIAQGLGPPYSQGSHRHKEKGLIPKMSAMHYATRGRHGAFYGAINPCHLQVRRSPIYETEINKK